MRSSAAWQGSPRCAATAAALAIAVGALWLVIDRHTWRSARTVTAVRLLYPGNSHRLITRFTGG